MNPASAFGQDRRCLGRGCLIAFISLYFYKYSPKLLTVGDFIVLGDTSHFASRLAAGIFEYHATPELSSIVFRSGLGVGAVSCCGL